MVKKSPERQENDSYNNSSSNSVKYKGVRKRKWGKWVSEIRLPNSRERIWLGSYDTPEKAARAFDAAQFCLRGKSANFNFPDNPPEIAGARSMTPVEIQAAAARFANLSTSGDDRTVVVTEELEEDHNTVEESADASSYSPSISDGATTVQMDVGFEMAGVETSFQEQMSLSNTLGSGNFVSEFGLFPGFDEFTGGEFLPTPQTDNFDYPFYGQYDTYDASLYQDSYLWNF